MEHEGDQYYDRIRKIYKEVQTRNEEEGVMPGLTLEEWG